MDQILVVILNMNDLLLMPAENGNSISNSWGCPSEFLSHASEVTYPQKNTNVNAAHIRFLNFFDISLILMFDINEVLSILDNMFKYVVVSSVMSISRSRRVIIGHGEIHT